ncbi:IscS subfamily cysteine desulfurase [Aquibacillus albus]|uniref:Cysteine desulfurase n=1 Tax=Aquibacillus albus TaxID=1168171 RepID=A0ABS2N1P2_9BACI|nr:IscS subfamily cysteine desulfurase [Aquibacillus albus]MBM7572044.1 cysteine desulfurase [Aquibacillus albus]
MIYLDYAATTPMNEHALQVYTEVSQRFFGNSNSLHDAGTTSKALLEQCKEELAKLIHGQSRGIFFTSGGSESNVLAVKSLLHAANAKGNHIITTRMEHSSLINYFDYLKTDCGYEITYLPVDQTGVVNIHQLNESICDETVLVSIQHANSEIGAVQPLEEIGQLLHNKGILFHSDCVQTFCKLPIQVESFYLDSVSISSHKIYGPKGVGAIYLHPSLNLSKYISNIRPGTMDVPGIAAFVSASQQETHNMEQEQQRLSRIRQQFVDQIKKRRLNVEIIQCNQQLPNIIGLFVNNMQGDYSMLEFNRNGIAVSTGSACTVGQQEPSKTLLAIGKSPERAKQFIRLSLGKQTTSEQMDRVVNVCESIIQSNQKKGLTTNV